MRHISLDLIIPFILRQRVSVNCSGWFWTFNIPALVLRSSWNYLAKASLKTDSLSSIQDSKTYAFHLASRVPFNAVQLPTFFFILLLFFLKYNTDLRTQRPTGPKLVPTWTMWKRNRRVFPGDIQAWVCINDWSVCAKSSNYGFLLPDTYSLRLHNYRDLLPRLANLLLGYNKNDEVLGCSS